MSAATIEGKRKPPPSTSRVGVTLHSCVRSLRGLLLGLHSAEGSPRGMNFPARGGLEASRLMPSSIAY
jgi:hypothetical protein